MSIFCRHQASLKGYFLISFWNNFAAQSIHWDQLRNAFQMCAATLTRPSLNNCLFVVSRNFCRLEKLWIGKAENLGSCFYLCNSMPISNWGYKKTPSAIVLLTFMYCFKKYLLKSKLRKQVAWYMNFFVVHFIDFPNGLTFVDINSKISELYLH